MRGRGTILKGDFSKYCTDFVPEQRERVLKTLILLDSFVIYGVLDEIMRFTVYTFLLWFI